MITYSQFLPNAENNCNDERLCNDERNKGVFRKEWVAVRGCI